MKQQVYLDHLIKRDNLLYERTDAIQKERGKLLPSLTIRDLNGGDDSKRSMLRKPDFQRATYAWTPDDCVDLLECVLEERVVPSVIMWISPQGLLYVLDGGHRISVLIAWLSNDWGDATGSMEHIHDEVLIDAAREAGKIVRTLLRSKKIAPYEDYREAFREFNRLEKEGKDPATEMTPTRSEMADKFRRWRAADLGFPILWVEGDYKRAEESFVKINKTGQRLTPWETKLVENRKSGAARLIMSIAQPEGAKHCWPSKEGNEKDRAKVAEIGNKVADIRQRLFEPIYRLPVIDQRQPLLGISQSRPDLVAPYVAELITVISGQRGVSSDTEELLQRTRGDEPSKVIENGWELIKQTTEALDQIYGPTSRSLTVMPLVYFYNDDGLCIRALLYGFLHWIGTGDEQTVFNRKLVFSANRDRFEAAIIHFKKDLVRRISRRIGSGPEVTIPVGRYYDGLLQLLLNDKNSSLADEHFRAAHKSLIDTLGLAKGSQVNADVPGDEGNDSRLFTGRERQKVRVQELVNAFTPCEICGGRLHVGYFTQIDHVEPHSKGGRTRAKNGRTVHPFCNNNRDTIANLKTGQRVLSKPEYRPTLFDSAPGTQLDFRFISTLFENETEPRYGGSLSGME